MHDAGCALVVSARDVESALAIAASTEIDAAILDLDLAGRHVWPVDAALDACQVPFVLVTSYGTLDVPPQFKGRLTLARPLLAGGLALAVDSIVAKHHPQPRVTQLGLLGSGLRSGGVGSAAPPVAIN